MSLELMTQAIKAECSGIADFLIRKNKSYGNSVYGGLAVFSKADWKERIAVRLDDKLSRLSCGREYPGDDTKLDIVGYLVLERVIDRLEEMSAEEIVCEVDDDA